MLYGELERDDSQSRRGRIPLPVGRLIFGGYFLDDASITL